MQIDDHELLQDEEPQDEEPQDEEPRSESRLSFSSLDAARAKAALTRCAATEQKLRDLLRTAQFFSASIRDACDVTSDLAAELEGLEGTLGGQTQKFRALVERTLELERELALAEQRAAEERRSLLEQQDAFIASLVSDHERALQRMTARAEAAERRVAELSAAADPPACR